MRPAGRYAAFALALALYAPPACADPARADPVRDREERRIKAEAAFESILCGPTAIRRRFRAGGLGRADGMRGPGCIDTLYVGMWPPDDRLLYWRAFGAWSRIVWPSDKATLRGARAR